MEEPHAGIFTNPVPSPLLGERARFAEPRAPVGDRARAVGGRRLVRVHGEERAGALGEDGGHDRAHRLDDARADVGASVVDVRQYRVERDVLAASEHEEHRERECDRHRVAVAVEDRRHKGEGSDELGQLCFRVGEHRVHWKEINEIGKRERSKYSESGERAERVL